MPQTKDVFKGWRILAVDDEADSLMVLELLLTMASATVFTASNGQEALEWLLSNPAPDLIITDLSMPVMDGWILFERLKVMPETATLPVFAFTAHAMPSDRQKVITAGFAQYLTKPLDPMTFVKDLAKLIRETPSLEGRLTPPTSSEAGENTTA